MAFIRNVDKLIEGLENKFFTEARAKAALAPELAAEESARLAGDSAEAAARESADNALDARLDVIEGSGEGSVAKAEQDAKDYADQKVADLVNSAPAVLDTLKELSDALGGDENFATTVAGQIGAVDGKVDQEILDRQSAVAAEQSARESADQALDGRLDLLEADSVTKAYVDGEVSDLQGQITQEISDRQSAVSSEQSARELADSSLSGRISVLEQDPTTKAYVDGEVSDLQGQITQEISDRQSAVSSEQSRAESAEQALDGRLDILEQDPTTKSYIDGEVSDLQGQITQEISDRQGAVSAEESRAMSAEAALDGRIDILEQDPTTKAYVDQEVSAEESRAMAAESALDGRLDVLEADPVTKSYVDGEVSDLQGQVDVEKGRIDAILSAADADKDSFAEIVSLINSVDTSNDSAFASYVLSNDAALAQEVSDREADVDAEEQRALAAEGLLDGRLDVLESDPTTKTYVDGQISSEASTRAAEDLTMLKKDGSRNVTGNLKFEKFVNIGNSPTSTAAMSGFSSAYGMNDGFIFAGSNNTTSIAIGSHQNLTGNAIMFFGNSSLTEYVELRHFSNNTGALSIARTSATTSGNLLRIGRSHTSGLASFDVQIGPNTPYAEGANLVWNGDGAGDIGYSSLQNPTFQRPNNVYVKTNIEFGGGMKVGFVSKASNYTLVSSNYIVAVSDLSVSKVMTLPSAVTMGVGKTFVIKDQSGAASQTNYIQIAPQSGEKIDGQNDYKIVMPYESVMLVSNGSHWFII